ncbi:hypothetical protein [Streptomyces chrestomyceticus]|uniref:hypothetical protein n=1 Tax=Streptomyces chrestomyceticus TaxID=68185 RepID=UPI0033FAFE82
MVAQLNEGFVHVSAEAADEQALGLLVGGVAAEPFEQARDEAGGHSRAVIAHGDVHPAPATLLGLTSTGGRP